MKSPYLKKVLITGATSGIGKATALLFAEKGFTVYAIARSAEEKTVDYPKGSITYLKADVTDIKSLENLKSKIKDLGIIVNCAGFGVSGSAEKISIEKSKAQMETNYFGVLNTNQVFLPLLRKNKLSLVLITGSVAGLIGIPYQSHYSSSKYALEAYTEALRLEGRKFGIRACIVEPGDTKTEFTAQRTHDEPKDSPYFAECNKAVKAMEISENKGKAPISVAKVFLRQTKRKNPAVRRAVGFDYKALALLKRILPAKLVEFILIKIYL